MAELNPKRSDERQNGSERFYGLEETKAKELREIVTHNIHRMLNVPDIEARQEVRRAWSEIGNLGQVEDVDSDHVQRVLDLVGGATPRLPLLGKVWGIINLCEASANFTPEQKGFRDEIWRTLGEAIMTDPDRSNISQMILLGAWLVGLAYRETEPESRTQRFVEIISEIDHGQHENPENRYGMQVSASLLAELLDIDKLRLGILTVDIQGGDKQQPEYRGSDLIAGYPDTIMILPEGSIHSQQKLEEGVSIGVPEVGRLVKRTLNIMIGLQRENPAGISTGIMDYPDRIWSFVTPGAFMLAEEELNTEAGEFVPDGLSLWLALQTIDSIKGKILPLVKIRNAVIRNLSRVQGRIRLQMKDGSIKNVPGILRSTLDYWQTNTSKNVDFDQASEQLSNSALGLILAASDMKDDDKYFVPGRQELFDTYKDRLWDSISLEDRLAFARVLFKPGSEYYQAFSAGEKLLYNLATDIYSWDEQESYYRQEIANYLFEDRTTDLAKHIASKQRKMLVGLNGDALTQQRVAAVENEIRWLRSKMFGVLQKELTIKAETIRNKIGEPGEMGTIIFMDEEE